MDHWRRKPNSFRARLASPKMTSWSFSSRVTLCAGTMPFASAAATVSVFARRRSAWSNWSGELIALDGIAPWWSLTKSMRPKSSTWTVGDFRDLPDLVEAGLGLDERMDRDLALDAGFSAAVSWMYSTISAELGDAGRLGDGEVRDTLARGRGR